MKYSYHKWKEEICGKETKGLAILSFPAVQLLDVRVKELLNDGHLQAEAMQRIVQRLPQQLAIVSMMDLSVEAEAFGCEVQFSDHEVPAVTGQLVHSLKEAQKMAVPDLTAGRCQRYIQAIRDVVKQADRAVFAGVIGPFSLAGRLMDVSEIMVECMMNPEYATVVLEKATAFLKTYIRAYKDAGANGVLMAEPLAGLLPPSMVEQFSSCYIKEICEELQDDDFSILYHNCGPSAAQSIEEILKTTCHAYHFGNAVSMKDVLQQIPADIPVMGNIDPVACFCNGTPEDMQKAVASLLEECRQYPNFVLSSGCDIPPTAKWENIDQFFMSLDDDNQRRNEHVL